MSCCLCRPWEPQFFAPTDVKPLWIVRKLHFTLCSSSFYREPRQESWQVAGMPSSCRFGFFGSWWGKTCCAPNSFELEQPFGPCGVTWTRRSGLGLMHDSIGWDWVPLICCFTSCRQLVSHSVPKYSPVPLCNVSWGFGVCPVLVRSVSPCRLVLEVRSFPSPPCAVLAFCPSFVSAFFVLLPFRVDPAPAGCVCVCV